MIRSPLIFVAKGQATTTKMPPRQSKRRRLAKKSAKKAKKQQRTDPKAEEDALLELLCVHFGRDCATLVLGCLCEPFRAELLWSTRAFGHNVPACGPFVVMQNRDKRDRRLDIVARRLNSGEQVGSFFQPPEDSNCWFHKIGPPEHMLWMSETERGGEAWSVATNKNLTVVQRIEHDCFSYMLMCTPTMALYCPFTRGIEEWYCCDIQLNLETHEVAFANERAISWPGRMTPLKLRSDVSTVSKFKVLTDTCIVNLSTSELFFLDRATAHVVAVGMLRDALWFKDEPYFLDWDGTLISQHARIPHRPQCRRGLLLFSKNETLWSASLTWNGNRLKLFNLQTFDAVFVDLPKKSYNLECWTYLPHSHQIICTDDNDYVLCLDLTSLQWRKSLKPYASLREFGGDSTAPQCVLLQTPECLRFREAILLRSRTHVGVLA